MIRTLKTPKSERNYFEKVQEGMWKGKLKVKGRAMAKAFEKKKK